MDHLLSIGEFSQHVGLSVSAVRFYADRDLIVPAHIDPSSGYRSFDSEQIATGCLVRDLRLIGLPLEQVKAALTLPQAEVQQLADAYIAGLEAELQSAHDTASSLGSRQESRITRTPATTVATVDLMRAFEQVLPFSSTDLERPHLMTVLIQVRDGSVRVVTTDTHRLAVRDLVALDAGIDLTALIASTTAQRWLAELRPGQEVHLELDGELLTASGGDETLIAHTVPANFPGFEPFLTQPEDAAATVVDRQAFVDALQRFDDMSGAVLLTATDHGMRIGRRDISVHVDGEHHGPPVHVAINPAYGAEAAACAIGSELVVEIEPDPLRPVLFRSATNGTYVSLLMPVKLD